MNLDLYQIVKFLHIMAVVFMSAPLYNLIVVNERALLGAAPFPVDRYMENLIKRSSTRCYIFQLTALVTGIALLPLGGYSLSELYLNWVLLLKFALLLLLTGLLSVVHFRIQPKIEAILSRVTGDEMPQNVADAVRPLRANRKRLAAVCLFLVITIVLLGLQVFTRFPAWWTVVLLVVAGLFSWRVFRTNVRFGWI